MRSLLLCCLLTGRVGLFPRLWIGVSEVCSTFIFTFVLSVYFCKPHIVCEGMINRNVYQFNFCVLQIAHLNAVPYLGQCLKLRVIGRRAGVGDSGALGTKGVRKQATKSGRNWGQVFLVWKQPQPDLPRSSGVWVAGQRVLAWDQGDGVLWPFVSQLLILIGRAWEEQEQFFGEGGATVSCWQLGYGCPVLGKETNSGCQELGAVCDVCMAAL